MYCKHCGSKVEGHHLFCPTCGNRLSEEPAKRFPNWLKALFGLLILGALIALVVQFKKSDSEDVIKNQLNALKTGKLTEAYYEYTSKEFQKSTSLEKFKEVIKSFPLLSQVNSLSIDEKDENEDDQEAIKATLDSDDNQSFKMDYGLTKEDGEWKIVFFKLAEAPKPIEETTTESANNPIDTIENQLNAIKSNNVDSAYSDYVTKDFKKATSLKAFKEFVQSHPILSDFTTKRHGAISDTKGVKKIKFWVSDDQGNKNILDYTLAKEGASWKVRGIELLPDDVEPIDEKAAAVDPSHLSEQVTNFINLIKNGEIEKGYEELTTDNFKSATSLEVFTTTLKGYNSFIHNDSVEFKKTSLKGKVGTVIAILKDNADDARTAQFDLIPVDDTWKIEQVLIFKMPEKDALSFKSIEVGTKKNEGNEILDATDRLTSPPRDIYINVFAENVSKGDKISVYLVNEKLKLKSAPVDHVSETDAISYVSFFYFTGPEAGWPPGDYKIIAKGSNGAEISSNFTIE